MSNYPQPAYKGKGKSSIHRIDYRQHEENQPSPVEVQELIFGKTSPAAPELEQTVLGACLMDATAFPQIADMLTATDFYEERHQVIFAVLEKLKASNSPIDLMTVSVYLRDHKLDEKIGGTYYLVELTNRVASAANLEYHARIVKQKAFARDLITLTLQTARKAYDESLDIFELYDELNAKTRVNNPRRILRVKSMNDSITEGSKEKVRKQLCGNLLRQGDVTILYGDEGTGKSILGFQMGMAISEGKPLFGLENDFPNECPPQKTLVFDFELETRELYDRYSEKGLAYKFSDNLLRSDLNPECFDLENGDGKLLKAVQSTIEQTQPNVVIVDNLTWIVSESQDTAIAGNFMKRLLMMRRKMDLTIIVIAHTPKRNTSEPIESKHLAGSANLKNFAKSLIAVSNSKLDPDVRYIKHIKCRTAAKLHGEDNVVVCQIEKAPGSALLHWDFMKYGHEQEHLATPELEMSEDEICRAALKLRNDKKMTWDEILTELNLSWSRRTLTRKIEKFDKTESWLE